MGIAVTAARSAGGASADVCGRPSSRAFSSRLAGLAGSAIPGAAAVTADGPDTAIEAYLRAEMAGSAIPGLAVAVVEDGRTIYAGALGTAVDGSPMTVATPVVIGSVGKSITALAIRQLVEAGRVELGAPLRTLPAVVHP